MKSPSRPKAPLPLPQKTERHLSAYAVAASAAGVSALALSGTAEAKVVYTPAHVVLQASGFHTYNLDLNHDGIADFSFIAYNEYSMSGQNAFLRCNPRAANDVWGVASSLRGHGDEGAFLPGVRIGPGGHYASHISMAFVFTFQGHSGARGPWANGGKGVKDRYPGLKFAINGKIHYGWARLNVKLGRLDNEVYIKATLTGYAYETIPNKAIITGKTRVRMSLRCSRARSAIWHAARQRFQAGVESPRFPPPASPFPRKIETPPAGGVP